MLLALGIYLTIDHASLPRRSIVPSTVPTPTHVDDHYLVRVCHFSPIYVLHETSCLSHPLPFSPSVATIYLLGYHRFFASIQCTKLPHVTFGYFPHLQNIPFLLVHFTFSRKARSALFTFATRAQTGTPLPSCWQVQNPYTKLSRQRFRVRSPLGRVNTCSMQFLLLNLLHIANCSSSSTSFF